MDHELTYQVNVQSDLEELSRIAAADICEEIGKSLSSKSSVTIALSGGNTPRRLYGVFAADYLESIPWRSVQVFFGDERYVPHFDELSNFKMARESLFDKVPIPGRNVHPIQTSLPSAEESAKAYEELLEQTFTKDDTASFDILLLGVGKEGHTASLFPGSPYLDEKERWVVAADVPIRPSKRITLTFPILNRANLTCVLASGIDKAEVIREIVHGSADYHAFPIKGVRPRTGRMVLYLDSASASRL